MLCTVAADRMVLYLRLPALQVSDWELNFKVLKAAARDAEKLPNEVKVRRSGASQPSVGWNGSNGCRLPVEAMIP